MQDCRGTPCTGMVKLRGFQILTDRVRSYGQVLRVGSGRVGSGLVGSDWVWSGLVGSGRFGFRLSSGRSGSASDLTQSDPHRLDLTRPHPNRLNSSLLRSLDNKQKTLVISDGILFLDVTIWQFFSGFWREKPLRRGMVTLRVIP